MPAGLTTEGLLGRRYMARFIDSVIILLLIGGIAVLGKMFSIERGHGLAAIAIDLLVLIVVWIGYGTVLESSPWQATLGKKMLGLRVYNAQGGRLAPPQAAGRNLVKDGPFLLLSPLPLLTLVWLCAHLVVLYRSPVYQAIHDRAAHTWVAAPESTIQLRLT